MEFAFDCNRIVPANKDGLGVLTPDKNGKNEAFMIENFINVLGEASRAAQGLQLAVTTPQRFLNSSNERIYAKIERSRCIGFVKVGVRKLFLYDMSGKIHEVEPLCVLDFFVHPKYQRCGIGKQLFDFMLSSEHISGPAQLAFDKPSNRSLKFIAKHYQLANPQFQNNNFVVDQTFFNNLNHKQPKWHHF